LAVILEKSYKEGRFSNRNKVDISDKKEKKIRWVEEITPGVYRQYRDSQKRNPEGRSVLRGYNGKLIDKPLSKKK